jgi:hypothetical protein
MFKKKRLELILKKIKKLEYRKIDENKYFVRFEKLNRQFKYIHVVDIIKKSKKTPIIQSYQHDSDNMVGLDIIEAKLFIDLAKLIFGKGCV